MGFSAFLKFIDGFAVAFAFAFLVSSSSVLEGQNSISLQKEAQDEAQRIWDNAYTKCGAYYYRQGGVIAQFSHFSGTAPVAKPMTLTQADQDNHVDWKGTVVWPSFKTYKEFGGEAGKWPEDWSDVQGEGPDPLGRSLMRKKGVWFFDGVPVSQVLSKRQPGCESFADTPESEAKRKAADQRAVAAAAAAASAKAAIQKQAQAQMALEESTRAVGYWKDGAGLMWAGKDDGTVRRNSLVGSGLSWNDAQSYCRNLSLGGYSGWRLPTIGELESVYDSSAPKHIKGGIILLGSYVWSSSSTASGEIWNFYFGAGSRYANDVGGGNVSGALCVRRP